jgi:hypothetical protein
MSEAENHMDMPPSLSTKTRHFCQLFQAMAMAGEKEATGDAFYVPTEKPALKDHLDFYVECLGSDELLTDDLLQKKLREIDQDSHLKEHYPAGRVIQLAIVPVTVNGNLLTDEEIQDGWYLQNLVRQPDKNGASGKTIDGFGVYPSYVHKLYPEKLQKCSFVVGPYDFNGPEDGYRVSAQDRERIKVQYVREFQRLRNRIGKKKEVGGTLRKIHKRVVDALSSLR